VPVEIERKFLTRSEDWRSADNGTRYLQGYLVIDPQRTVRVRLADRHAWLTIKGPAAGAVRAEFEYPIPEADAAELLHTLCIQPLIEKVRYRIDHAGHTWEVDEFSGANAGLIIAEVELAAADEHVELPEWVGEEVTHDPRYHNSSLQGRPFQDW